MTLIDDATRFCYVYLLKTKDEALDYFKIYKEEVENQLDRKIKKLRSDHGGEFFSNEFDLFCDDLKHRICNGDGTRVLAAKCGNCDRGLVGVRVKLEVDEPHREYKHITLVEHLGEELVVWVRRDEADIECSLKHRDDLSGTRMCVGRVLTQRCIVNACN